MKRFDISPIALLDGRQAVDGVRGRSPRAGKES